MSNNRLKVTSLEPNMIRYYVYWIHTKDMKCIASDGYIGVTHSPYKRATQHCDIKSNDTNVARYIQECGVENVEFEVIAFGSKDECYDLENILRPEPFIGWNLSIGGGKSALNKTRKRGKLSGKALENVLNGIKKRAKKKSPFKGKIRWDEDTKKIIGSYHVGKEISKEHIESMRQKMREYHPSMKYITMQYVDGKKITFKSISSAYRDGKVSPSQSALKSTVRKGSKSYNSLGWRVIYEESHPDLGNSVKYK